MKYEGLIQKIGQEDIWQEFEADTVEDAKPENSGYEIVREKESGIIIWD